MKELTASRLRRSCSFLRAISLSLSTEDCVVTACISVGDSGDICCSTSLGDSEVVSLQMLSGESGSSLEGCGFVSALHGPGKLEGECPVN